MPFIAANTSVDAGGPSMASSADRHGLATVLEWYRQRLTFRRWGNRVPVVVPAEYSGWILAAPGDWADADGCVPMGAVRARLVAVLDEVVRDPRERAAFEAVWGISEWPGVDVARPITRRLTVQRRRRGHDGAFRQELTHTRVAQLATAALRRVDPQRARRPGARPVVSGPVPDPTRSTWLAALSDRVGRSRRWVLVEAVDHARLFLTRTGTTGAVEAVLAELDRYVAVLRSTPDRLARPDRPVGTSRVRALVSIGAWEVLRSLAAGRPAAMGVEPDPTAFGVLRPPVALTSVAAVVAALLAGDATDEVLSGCCDEVHRLVGIDPGAASVVADLLLAHYPLPGRPAVRVDTAARILQTAVRLRSRDEDWTAVALVRQMVLRHPRSHRTLDALMYAVQVPTAHSRWEIAEEILGVMAWMLAGGFTVPTGRVLTVETVEYRVWTRHQVTATVRRRLQEYGQRASGSAARVALRHQGAAIGDLDRALALNESVGRGDASDAWRSILLIREAELYLAAADLTSASDATRHHRRAERALADVVRLERVHPTVTTDAVAYLKAHLSLALRTRDDDVAAQLLADLHQIHHWPLHRSVPEVSAVAAGRRDPAVGPRLRALVRHLVHVEGGTTWQPAVSPANRNRRARAT